MNAVVVALLGIMAGIAVMAYDGADDGEPGIPDPTPPGDVLVPYGKSGVLVHRRCAQDRVAACEWCARVLGRTKAVAP